MGVNLIFRIAAVGILVSVICQVLRHSGREEQLPRLRRARHGSAAQGACGTARGYPRAE